MTNLIAFYFLTQIQNYLTLNSSPWTDDQCEEHPFRHSTKLFLNCAVVSLVCGAKKEYYSLNQYGTCGCCLSSTSSQSLCPVCVWGVKIRTILVGFSGNFFADRMPGRSGGRHFCNRHFLLLRPLCAQFIIRFICRGLATSPVHERAVTRYQWGFRDGRKAK